MSYKSEDYEINPLSAEYRYDELYIHGKEGDFFELVSSPVREYIGTRVAIKVSTYGKVVKHANFADDSSSTSLITPYAAITGAKFKRLQRKDQYIEIGVGVAVSRLIDRKPVFVLQPKTNTYKLINMYESFQDLEVHDFDDLSERKFFIKK